MRSTKQISADISQLADKGMDLLAANAPEGTIRRLDAELKNLEAELGEAASFGKQHAPFQFAGHSDGGASYLATAGGSGPTLGQGTKALAVPPAVDLPEAALKALFQAAVQRRSFRADIGTKEPEQWGDYVPATLAPTVLRQSEPNRVAALLPAMAMSSPSIEYVRVLGQTGAAAVVAEGTAKPAVQLLTDKLEARAAKIAVLSSVTDESLEDYPAFQMAIIAELQRCIIDAESDQLLNGNGTAPNMTGLMNTAGILTRDAPTGSDTALDTLEQAVADLRVGSAFAEADAFVMHPADWSTVRRTKDSQGRYIAAQDPTAADGARLWGTKVVCTTVCPQGTALVGQFSIGACLCVKRGLTVETANQSEGDWTNNLTSFRLELREALPVLRPAAFCKVTLPAAG